MREVRAPRPLRARGRLLGGGGGGLVTGIMSRGSIEIPLRDTDEASRGGVAWGWDGEELRRAGGCRLSAGPGAVRGAPP